jgi:hypothetical protein
MQDDTWPKRILEQDAAVSKKHGHPRRNQRDDMDKAMESRDLPERNWNDRQVWEMGIVRQ